MSDQPPGFTEYPRPNYNSGGSYHRGPGVYFESIGEAWALVLKDPGHWIAGTIVYIAIGWALSLPISMLTQSMMPARPNIDQIGQVFAVLALQLVLNLIPIAIQNVLFVGLISMGIRKSKGEYINVGMMFEPFRDFGRIFASGLLLWVVIFASIIACIVPSLFFIPVLFLMPVVAYQRKANAFESLSLTFDACKNYWASLLALGILMFFVMVGGLLACVVGYFIAFPMFCVVSGIHYRAFFEPAETSPPVWP